MSTTPPQPPKYSFKATIPGYPDLASEGNINNLNGVLNQPVPVPRKVGQRNGSKTVNLPSQSILTLLFIKPTNIASTECRKLYFIPGTSSMPGPYATQETPGSDLPQQPPDLGSDAPQQGGGHQHGGGGDQTGPKDYEQTGDPQQQYPVYKMPPPPPPPPKDSPHGVCIYTPKDPKDPSKGGNYFYPKDPNDPSQGGTYYTVSPGGQQTSIATQSTAGTKSSTELTSTTQTPAGAGSSTGLSLENDLFLIGGDLISRLLGNVTSIKLENASDKEVTVQVVIGYDTVDTENSEY